MRMSLDISISESRKFLICTVHVPVTTEIAKQIALETDRFAVSSGIRNRLIDVRNVQNVESVIRNYDLAYKDFGEMKIDRTARAAVLTALDDSSHDFAILALQNAGYNARRFTDEQAAIDWLEEHVSD